MTKRRPPTPEETQAGKALERAMKAAGLTQLQFAERMGVSPGLISQWVAAMPRMPYPRAERAARLLGVSPESICVAYRNLPRRRGSAAAPPVDRAETPEMMPDELRAVHMAWRSLTAILSEHAPIVAKAFAEHLDRQAAHQGLSSERGLIAEILHIAQPTPAKSGASRKSS
jgi:transcriptional regulator with XRE-family HTH domain